MRAGAISGWIEDALELPPNASDLRAATLSSFKMVFEEYGMVAVTHMEYFCTIVNRAHLYDIVLDEALTFKKYLEAFKTKHGTHWKLGRLLRLEEIENLDATRYPHLYTAAIARAQGPQGKGLGEYKSSLMNIKENRQTLAAAANTQIAGDNRLLKVIIDKVKLLTGNDLSSHLDRPLDRVI